ncbi:hypothetical protein BDC45DRAFT_516056 [Circinella umbellata]|nr:hypothetical protein BDC45DRAFT_516056 [Circinella umbellata]
MLIVTMVFFNFKSKCRKQRFIICVICLLTVSVTSRYDRQPTQVRFILHQCQKKYGQHCFGTCLGYKYERVLIQWFSFVIMEYGSINYRRNIPG